MGWGYWSYPQIMSVDSWKFLDARRMTNICERWAADHTDALQYALWNGVGFESWESVWGTWNGITPRDGEQVSHPHGPHLIIIILISSSPHLVTDPACWFDPAIPREQAVPAVGCLVPL